LDALNELTAVYIKASHVTRILHEDIDILLNEFPDLTGVVAFPVFTLEQVLQITDAGNVVPGPSIIEYPGTAAVVYSGQRAVIDEWISMNGNRALISPLK